MKGRNASCPLHGTAIILKQAPDSTMECLAEFLAVLQGIAAS
jgi:hypothetical protein